MILTDEELDKIINWLPYKDDWPIDRNRVNDGIEAHYGDLVTQLIKNSIFHSYVFHNGGMSNYLDYVCYPGGNRDYSGPAISLLISLCAPIAAFGQISCTITNKFASVNEIVAEQAGVITSVELFQIKSEIVGILNSNSIIILEKEFLSQRLPADLLKQVSFPLGEQYLHGLFQMAD